MCPHSLHLTLLLGPSDCIQCMRRLIGASCQFLAPACLSRRLTQWPPVLWSAEKGSLCIRPQNEGSGWRTAVEMALVAGEESVWAEAETQAREPHVVGGGGKCGDRDQRSLGSLSLQNIAAQKVTHFHVGHAQLERKKLSQHKCEAIASEDKAHGLVCFSF